MAASNFNGLGFLTRFVVAIILVFSTYNPSGHSWIHWLIEATRSQSFADPLLWLSLVVLIIGWAIYLRATVRSLGLWGLLLVSALFAALLWLMYDWGWLSLDNPTMMSWIALLLLSTLLTIGISWSHIRRRITGQVDVDDVETEL